MKISLGKNKELDTKRHQFDVVFSCLILPIQPGKLGKDLTMTFKQIETQEELDQIITDRLNRQKASYEEKLTDYDKIKQRNEELETENNKLQTSSAELAEKAKGYDQNIADLNAKIAGYETASMRNKVALAHGLPIDLADRLQGDDEESLTKDAERLAGFIKKSDPPAPLRDPEPPAENNKSVAYKKLAESLSTEGDQ